MKILFYGNCQTQVVMQAVANSNPDVETDYAGNSRRVAKFDPDRTERLFDWVRLHRDPTGDEHRQL